MKMKTKITLICTLALALLLSGCAADNGMTPTPTVRPTLSADPTLTVTPDDTNTPDVSASPGGDMGGADGTGGAGDLMIDGFKEGDAIDPKQLPEAITNSIKEKYPEGVIKSAAYTTYENQQMYKLILQNVGNSDSTECYVKPDGTIVPATAAEGGTAANG